MAAARLNNDVLMIVCKFLVDSSDVLSFALVCSSLRPVAIERLIGMAQISLTTSDSVDKFHTFLFADARTRARHVHALNIVADQLMARTHQARLIEILTSCQGLTDISITIVNLIPTDIVRTIISLRSLRSVSIYGSFESLVVMLAYECCPSLRKLAIYFPPADGTQVWSPRTMKRLLPRFPATIQELKFGNFAVDQDDLQIANPIPPSSASDIKQYAGVRSLYVDRFVGLPLLGHLQHVFPALDDVPDNEYAGLRDMNQRAQDGEGGALHARSWKKLDRLVCNAPMLYVLGLRCPVRLLTLDRCPVRVLRYVADAIRENPVPRLKLELLLGDELRGIDTLCSPELAGLVYPGTGGDEAEEEAQDASAKTVARLPWTHFLDKMISALRCLHKLTHLRVVLQSDVSDRSYQVMLDSDAFLGTVRPSAFDFAGTSTSLARSLPSLQYVFLTTLSLVWCLPPDIDLIPLPCLLQAMAANVLCKRSTHSGAKGCLE
ncbi:hypothetical protein V8D89_002920 [Ganoderma adspersum]